MIAVLLVVALIAYGSLYPLSFQPNPYASLRYILRSIPYTLTPRLAVDAVANVLLYIPLGLAVFLHLRPRVGRAAGALISIAGSFALSLSLEYLQFFQPGRVPTGSDVVTNTMGGAAGVVAAGLWSGFSPRLRIPSGPALILWPTWVLSLLFPLMPAIGYWSLRFKLRAAATFDLTTFIGATLQWLLAGLILAHQRPVWTGATLLLVFAQFAIAERQPTLGLLAGALAGSTIALSRLQPKTNALLVVVLLALWGLSPFRPGPTRTVLWTPFGDAIDNTRTGAISVTFTKCFVYGGTILLLSQTGLRLGTATLLVAGLLSLTEAAQTRIAGRTPASTDPVIALLFSVVLARFRLPARRGFRSTA